MYKFSLWILGFMAFSSLSFASEPVACTMEYAPVCGKVQVQCIKAPCDPVPETFANRCMAVAGHATDIREGACESVATAPKKMSPHQALQAHEWNLSSYNGMSYEKSDITINFEKNRFSAKVCNTMNGRYSLTIGSRLVTRQVVSTMMYCEGLMDIEAILGGSRFVTMVGSDTLTMKTKNGDTLIWKK
jgi:heat shock protein HslJ